MLLCMSSANDHQKKSRSRKEVPRRKVTSWSRNTGLSKRGFHNDSEKPSGSLSRGVLLELLLLDRLSLRDRDFLIFPIFPLLLLLLLLPTGPLALVLFALALPLPPAPMSPVLPPPVRRILAPT